MKAFVSFITLLLTRLQCSALGAHNLNEEYRFSAELDSSYKLHWTFDLEAGTIAFAVNVSTTGWVGFGLSPTGQMPGSDVVIGWVQNNGQVEFQVRNASEMRAQSSFMYIVFTCYQAICAGSICNGSLPPSC